MKHKVETSWKGEMAFEATVSGHKIMMDTVEEFGGKDRGARPKQLMLAALAGCTGMDVVSILNKMKVQFDSLEVSVEGNVTEDYPQHYDKMHVIYKFNGKDLPLEKIEKAIKLSQDQYCGVSAVYKKSMPVTYEIVIS